MQKTWPHLFRDVQQSISPGSQYGGYIDIETAWKVWGVWSGLISTHCYQSVIKIPVQGRSAHAILMLHRIAIFLHFDLMKIEIIELFPLRQTCAGYFRAIFHTSIRGLRGGLVLHVRFFLRWWNCMSISKMVSVPPSWCIFLHSWNTFRHRLCHTWCERRTVSYTHLTLPTILLV